MKLKLLSIALILAPVIFVSSVKAEPFNYNYAEAAYVYFSPDGDELDDGHGVKALLSWSPIENFLVEGGYQYLHIGLVGPADIDENLFRYGVGAYTDLMDKLDLVGRVGGLSVNAHLNDVEGDLEGDNSENENGVYAGAALRYEAAKGVELEPGIEYTHINSDGAWFYEIKTLFEATESLEYVLSAGITEETDVELTAGFRYNFGCDHP